MICQNTNLTNQLLLDLKVLLLTKGIAQKNDSYTGFDIDLVNLFLKNDGITINKQPIKRKLKQTE